MGKTITGDEEATEGVDIIVAADEAIGTREVEEGMPSHLMSAINLQLRLLPLPINHKHPTKHKHLMRLVTRK